MVTMLNNQTKATVGISLQLTQKCTQICITQDPNCLHCILNSVIFPSVKSSSYSKHLIVFMLLFLYRNVLYCLFYKIVLYPITGETERLGK